MYLDSEIMAVRQSRFHHFRISTDVPPFFVLYLHSGMESDSQTDMLESLPFISSCLNTHRRLLSMQGKPFAIFATHRDFGDVINYIRIIHTLFQSCIYSAESASKMILDSCLREKYLTWSQFHHDQGIHFLRPPVCGTPNVVTILYGKTKFIFRQMTKF